MPAIGRIANYSSLRKHRPMENQIYDSYFGMSPALVTFYCFIIIIIIFKNNLTLGTPFPREPKN